MKQILLVISSLIMLVGCNNYTVKFDVDAKVGDEDITAGSCKEYSDNFFGILGDFPVTVTVGEKEKELDANNWVVTTGDDGEINATKTDEACEVPKEADAEAGDETDGAGSGEGEETSERTSSATDGSEGPKDKDVSDPVETDGAGSGDGTQTP